MLLAFLSDTDTIRFAGALSAEVAAAPARREARRSVGRNKGKIMQGTPRPSFAELAAIPAKATKLEVLCPVRAIAVIGADGQPQRSGRPVGKCHAYNRYSDCSAARCAPISASETVNNICPWMWISRINHFASRPLCSRRVPSCTGEASPKRQSKAEITIDDGSPSSASPRKVPAEVDAN